MGQRDASRVQLDFPELVADIIRQLSLTGTLGLLEFSDQVTPVYIVAQRAGALAFSADLPVFQSPEITSGTAQNPVANAIIGDTGLLAAGDYDIWGGISISGNYVGPPHGPIALQHRNAANAVTLANLLQVTLSTNLTNVNGDQLRLTGYRIALNERLRFQNLGGNFTGGVHTVIAARLRPTP